MLFSHLSVSFKNLRLYEDILHFFHGEAFVAHLGCAPCRELAFQRKKNVIFSLFLVAEMSFFSPFLVAEGLFPGKS